MDIDGFYMRKPRELSLGNSRTGSQKEAGRRYLTANATLIDADADEDGTGLLQKVRKRKVNYWWTLTDFT